MSSVSRAIWSECGINISQLETTEIPNTIRLLRWGNFVFPRPQFNPEIVREFYAALVPDVFKESGTVIVRGFKVEITAKLINKYFHTPDTSNDPVIVLKHPEIFDKIDPRFVSELRWDGRNMSQDLRYKELHPEMAFWTTFINRNLMISMKPLSSNTILPLEMAQLLFSIKKCLPMDVGQIIHTLIGDANKNASSLLPFPSIVTHFCRVAGVNIHGNLCSPVPDIGRVWYNGFAQSQGLPTLVSRKRGRESVPLQPQPGSVDRPKWVSEITGRLNSLSEMMVGQFNALSTQINNLGVRVTSLEDAMRDAGFKQLNPSRRVRLCTK